MVELVLEIRENGLLIKHTKECTANGETFNIGKQIESISVITPGHEIITTGCKIYDAIVKWLINDKLWHISFAFYLSC